jgi:restriction system protein
MPRPLLAADLDFEAEPGDLGSRRAGLAWSRCRDSNVWVSTRRKSARRLIRPFRVRSVPRRRRNQSVLEDFAQPFQHLPWSAGLVTAVVLLALGFLLPHFPSSGLLATVLMVLLPWLLWITAGLVVLYSAVGVARRALDRRRFDRTEDVGRLDPYQYERYVGEYYRRKGYSVTQRGGAGADGGIDLVIAQQGERLLVQCKHWKASRVGPQPLRELWGLVDHEKATGALFVTSQDFTVEARAFAKGKRLELVDGKQLAAMVAATKKEASRAEPGRPAAESHPAAQKCPSCGAPMVVRTAQRGSRSGEQFLGCSSYPRCWGVRPLAQEAAAAR